MKIVSSFKHLEHTPALDQKIHQKSQKLKKYFDGNFEVQWTCYVRDDGAQCAEIKLLGPSFEYHANAFADNLYKSLDKVVGKIERQVQKKKEKLRSRINHKHSPTFKETQVAESEWDEDFWQNKEDMAS